MGIIRIYQWLFSSFVPNGEIGLIEELESQGLIRAMLLKRTWLFGVFLFVRYLPIIIILTLGKVYFIQKSFPDANLYTNIVVGIVALLALISIIYSLYYLILFRRVHRSDKIYKKLDLLKTEAHMTDRVFAGFFNSVTLNYLILILFIIIEISYAVLVELYLPQSMDFQGAVFVVLSIACSGIEIIALQRFRKHMIDMEMDYAVITISKIFIQNQENMLSQNRVIERGKMRGITASYPGYFGSILKYGTIEILMEGTSSAIHIEYIADPVDTVTRINNIIRRSSFWGENSFLMKILENQNIDNPQSDQGKKEIQRFLREHEGDIKKDYIARNIEGRKEIESVLREYY